MESATFNVNIYKSFSHSAAGTVVAIDPMTLVLVHRQDFMMQSHHEIANRLRPGDWAWGVSRISFKAKHVVFISFWHVSTCFNNAPMDPSLIPHISHLPTNPILDPGTSIEAFHDALQLLHFWSLDVKKSIGWTTRKKTRRRDSSYVTAKPSLKPTASSSHLNIGAPTGKRRFRAWKPTIFWGAKW